MVGIARPETFVGLVLGVPLERFSRTLEVTVGRWWIMLQRYTNFVGLSVRERLAGALLELAMKFGAEDSRGILLTLKVTHADLAELVGASRQRTTEQLNDFENERVILRDGRRLIIVPDRLRELVAGLRKSNSLGRSRQRRGGDSPRDCGECGLGRRMMRRPTRGFSRRSKFLSAQSRFFSANGLKLHYLDFGNPSKPPLVCIHGLSGNAHNFDALASYLSDDYHVMSVDVRGRGDSDWGPPGEYTAPVYVNDLALMLDALELDRVTLIGTSMGGIVAMIFAGGYPDRVERLVLNDVGPEVDPAGLKRITDYFTDAPRDFTDMAEVVAYYRANYPFGCYPRTRITRFCALGSETSGHGHLIWKIDPACVISRAPELPPADGHVGAVCANYARIPWWCAAPRAISSRAIRPSACARCCPEQSASRFPGSATLLPPVRAARRRSASRRRPGARRAAPTARHARAARPRGGSAAGTGARGARRRRPPPRPVSGLPGP